jgi:hypothetical protein
MIEENRRNEPQSVVVCPLPTTGRSTSGNQQSSSEMNTEDDDGLADDDASSCRLRIT